MQLQLDSQDIHLLRELAGLGAVSSRVLDQDHRLERLELDFSLHLDRIGPAHVYRHSGVKPKR
jgi:hypothetical protein